MTHYCHCEEARSADEAIQPIKNKEAGSPRSRVLARDDEGYNHA